MKKRIRTALTIIGIGSLLTAIGMIMGGNIENTFYKSINGAWSMNNEHTRTVLSADIDETPLIAHDSVLKQLKADVSYVTLRIEPHNKQFVTYSIADNSKKLGASVRVEGNVLTVSTNKNRNWNWLFGWHRDNTGHSKTVITVKIPQNTLFDTADINIGAGSLLLDGFAATQRFTLNAGAGEIDVKNITASNVDIKTGVGETVFHNCSFTDTVMNTGIGETFFDGKIFKNLDLKAGIGEIDMHINGKKADYSIDTKSGIGSIFINGRNASGIGSTFRVTNQKARHTIGIKSGIGEINITFTE